MKIMTVLGTRPEIIKLSPLLPLLDEKFEHILVHSGQHYSYNLDSSFFEELKLKKPKYNLKVGSHSQAKQTAMILEKVEEVILKEKPDLILALGDTNTTLAAALSAAKTNTKFGHIEAGCRSFNKNMPEEINRIVADHCSDYLFAPDKKAFDNLLKEGIDRKKIFLTGSLVIDACLRNIKLAENSEIENHLSLKKGNYILATVHRAENTDNIEVLREIISSFNELSERIKIVFSVHPRTMKIIKENNIQIGKNIVFSEPFGYIDLLKLMQNARFIISDSGGIQEEASVVNTPCIIPRNETEWTRLVSAGKNFVAGNKKQGLLESYDQLMDDDKLDAVKKINVELVKNADSNMISILQEISWGN